MLNPGGSGLAIRDGDAHRGVFVEHLSEHVAVNGGRAAGWAHGSWHGTLRAAWFGQKQLPGQSGRNPGLGLLAQQGLQSLGPGRCTPGPACSRRCDAPHPKGFRQPPHRCHTHERAVLALPQVGAGWPWGLQACSAILPMTDLMDDIASMYC